MWNSLWFYSASLIPKKASEHCKTNMNLTPRCSSRCPFRCAVHCGYLTWTCYRRVPPCAVKTCAVRPVFARVVGELRAADPSNVQGPVKQNARPGEQSRGSETKWKPGQEQNPGPENQDSQHMLEQPRGPFPDVRQKTRLQPWNDFKCRVFLNLGFGEPMFCTLDSRGFRHFRGFRDFRQSGN